MKMRKLLGRVRLANLIMASIIYRAKAGLRLIGTEFDTFGRKLSFQFLLRKDYNRFINLFCNPVSIVRYFEFPFCYKAVDWSKIYYWLDISSPRLFFPFVLNYNNSLTLVAANPDQRDLDETLIQLRIAGFSERFDLRRVDARNLPFPDSRFDVVTSISVLEHVPEFGDSLIMKEAWRVLKPGGRLVITVPCAKAHFEEYRDADIYGFGDPRTVVGGKIFFQRFYDKKSIEERLCAPIKAKPKRLAIFGENIEGLFFDYEKRWMKFGLTETIKDPYYISRDYQHYQSILQLPGIGVCGMAFMKE